MASCEAFSGKDYRTGGTIPGTEGFAFSFSDTASASVPLLIATPHAGRAYPDEVLRTMRSADLACRKLEDRYIDLVADRLVRETGAAQLVAHAPRALLDLNRDSADVDWSMVAGKAPTDVVRNGQNRRARSGLGLVPRRLPGHGDIWKQPLAREGLDARIAQIHTPYHHRLSVMLDALRDRFGVALLLDLHSMPPLQGPTPELRGPEFVIGDRFGSACAHGLSAAALVCLSRDGRSVAHNRPYAGGYILDRHAAPRRQIHAMQLEVCRTTYLDARMDRPSARLPSLVRQLTRLAHELVATVYDFGIGHSLRDAAE